MTVSPATSRQDAFHELDLVRTLGTIGTQDGVLPSGSLGTVVLVHRDGRAFEVEFAEPVMALVTLHTDEIEAA